MTDNHIQTVYGDQILRHELDRLGPYVAVVDPIPWQMCRAEIPEPLSVVLPTSVERSELDMLAEGLPECCAVVGIGGGMVLDAAKYLALCADTPVVLAPSITSNNAPFSDSISVRTAGEPTGMVAVGQAKRVVVDFNLIQRADARLNRAGFADLLAVDIALRDIRRAADQGRVVLNEEACRETAGVVAECRAAAPRVGAGGRAGLEFVMRMFDRMTSLPSVVEGGWGGSGSEHLLAWNIEAVTGRHFVHGELVALGIVVAGVAHGDDGSLQRALDEAQVRYRLAELGLAWEELEHALSTVDGYNRRVRQFETVFTDLHWADGLLAAVRAAVGR